MNYQQFENLIKEIDVDKYQKGLRVFGVECALRVSHLLSVNSKNALQKSIDYAEGKISKNELAEYNEKAQKDVLKATPFDGVPTAETYATSASVDASSIWDRSHSNILAVSSCVASALATEAGDKVAENFDEVFDKTFTGELEKQVKMLESILRGISE